MADQDVKSRARQLAMEVLSGMGGMPDPQLQPVHESPENAPESEPLDMAAMGRQVFGGMGGVPTGGPQPAPPEAPPEEPLPTDTTGMVPRDMSTQTQEQPPMEVRGGVAVPETDFSRAKRELRISRRKAGESEEFRGQEADELERAAELQEKAAEEQARVYQESEADLRELQTARRRGIDQAQEKLNEFSKRYTMASAEGTAPAPSLVEARTDAGIQAAIVHGLGALAMIVTRGNTNALAPLASQIVRRAEMAIQRDVQDKIRRIDNLKTATSMADRQLQSLRQTFDDDRSFLQYVTQAHLDRAVKPIVMKATSSKNLAAATGARAAEAVLQANAANARAGLETSIAAQEQKNAQLRLAAKQQAEQSFQPPFEIDTKRWGTAAAKEVMDEWQDTQSYVPAAQRMVQLRAKLGPLARLGGVGALLEGGEERLSDWREFKALVREVFAKDTDLGAALTPTEIGFGEDKMGDPLSWLTGKAALDRVLRARALTKTQDALKKIKAMGRMTTRGRMEAAALLKQAGGARDYAPRPAARRKGGR